MKYMKRVFDFLCFKEKKSQREMSWNIDSGDELMEAMIVGLLKVPGRQISGSGLWRR